MCTITVCPQGSDKNSDFLFEALKISGLTNTDGGGFTFKRHTTKKVYISKGYTCTQDLIDAIVKHKLKDVDELVIHQRIGNKGAKNTDMCHPFVLSSDKSEILQNNKYVKSPTMVHNGTFHSYSKLNSEFSDTYWFIYELMYQKDLINMLKTDIQFFKDLLTNKLSTNRLCFLFPDEEQQLIKLGEYKEDSGYFFSNESYKNKNIRNVGGVNHYSSTYGSEYDWEDETNDYRMNRFLHMPALPVNTKIDDDLALPIKKNKDDKPYKDSSIIRGDLVVTSGICLTDPNTDVNYRLYMDMWIPDKYKTDYQFTSIKFNPTIFNYMDFSYSSISGDKDLEVEKGVIYEIINFQGNDKLIAMRRKFEIAGKINNIIYVPLSRLIILFNITPKSTELYKKHRGFYELCKEHQASKNNLKKINKILDVTNFHKKKNTIYKGVDYRSHAALSLFQNVLTKKHYPANFMKKLSERSMVIFD